MKRTIILTLLVLLLTSTYTLSAQIDTDTFNAYGKLHLGLSIQDNHYSIIGGASYGTYLGKHKRFGTGIGCTLYTYDHKTISEQTEGGGIAVFLESVLLSHSQKYSLTAFGGIGFLNLNTHRIENRNENFNEEFSKKHPLIGIGIDYYPKEKLSLGLRTSYAFLETHKGFVPPVHTSFSVGTRF